MTELERAKMVQDIRELHAKLKADGTDPMEYFKNIFEMFNVNLNKEVETVHAHLSQVLVGFSKAMLGILKNISLELSLLRVLETNIVNETLTDDMLKAILEGLVELRVALVPPAEPAA